MAEAVASHLVQQLGQLLPQAAEVRLAIEAARTVAVTTVLIAVDDVDVGGKVELAATELAQAEHDQPHRRSVRRAHVAMARGKLHLKRAQGGLQAGLGQLGAARERRVDVVKTQHVAPHQPR